MPQKFFPTTAPSRKVCVFGSARTPPSEAQYAVAEEFAREMVAQNYMVITGGGDGIMGAAQKGAGREHGFGLNIRLPFEQRANPIIEGDPKLINFNYFFTRKLNFVKETHAFALFPGGFGTMDEGFEVLTLMQTGKARIIPVVLLDRPGGSYWRNLDEVPHRPSLQVRLHRSRGFSFFQDHAERGRSSSRDRELLQRLSIFALGGRTTRRPAQQKTFERRACRIEQNLLRYPAHRLIVQGSGSSQISGSFFPGGVRCPGHRAGAQDIGEGFVQFGKRAARKFFAEPDDELFAHPARRLIDAVEVHDLANCFGHVRHILKK